MRKYRGISTVEGGDYPLLTPTNEAMTLTALLADYLLAREASPRYVESLQRTIRRLASCGVIYVRELEPQFVNGWLNKWTELSPTTRSNMRRELLTLWRYAHECGYTDVQPIRVKKIRAVRKSPEAWSNLAMQTLLLDAEQDKTPVSNRLKGVLVCHILPCWIMVGYESGLRLTDMLALTEENFRNSTIVAVANKTGKVTVRPISPIALQMCERLFAMSPDGSLFSWALPRRRALRIWRAFIDKHGHRGSSKWLRRSGATALESEHPGAATKWLDHSNPALCRLHYIDPTLLSPVISPRPLR